MLIGWTKPWHQLPLPSHRLFITMTSEWARWRPKSPASRLFTQPFIERRSKKTSKLRVTGLWAANSFVTGEFPAQMASNAENASIWWRHHAYVYIHMFFKRFTQHVLWITPLRYEKNQLISWRNNYSSTNKKVVNEKRYWLHFLWHFLKGLFFIILC